MKQCCSETIFAKNSEFYIEQANIQHKTTTQIFKYSQYNLLPMPFDAQHALL